MNVSSRNTVKGTKLFAKPFGTTKYLKKTSSHLSHENEYCELVSFMKDNNGRNRLARIKFEDGKILTWKVSALTHIEEIPSREENAPINNSISDDAVKPSSDTLSVNQKSILEKAANSREVQGQFDFKEPDSVKHEDLPVKPEQDMFKEFIESFAGLKATVEVDKVLSLANNFDNLFDYLFKNVIEIEPIGLDDELDLKGYYMDEDQNPVALSFDEVVTLNTCVYAPSTTPEGAIAFSNFSKLLYVRDSFNSRKPRKNDPFVASIVYGMNYSGEFTFTVVECTASHRVLSFYSEMEAQLFLKKYNELIRACKDLI